MFYTLSNKGVKSDIVKSTQIETTGKIFIYQFLSRSNCYFIYTKKISFLLYEKLYFYIKSTMFVFKIPIN